MKTKRGALFVLLFTLDNMKDQMTFLALQQRREQAPKGKPVKWVVKSGSMVMYEAPVQLCWEYIKMHGLTHLKPVPVY